VGAASSLGWRKAITTFYHPDYTVGPGVSPDPAPGGARGLYHRSGIVVDRDIHHSPCPEGYYSIGNVIIAFWEAVVNGKSVRARLTLGKILGIPPIFFEGETNPERGQARQSQQNK